MDAQLASQFPQYAALILAAGGFGWYLKYSRAEREACEARYTAEREAIAVRHAAEREEWRQANAEQQGLWREFMSTQQREWHAQLDRVVLEFRNILREDREENLAELHKLGEALQQHDKHAQDVAERVASVLAVKLVETAKGTTAAAGAGQGGA